MDKELRHIRTILYKAVEWGYIPAVPKFKGLFVGDKEGKRVVMSDADIKAISKALGSRKLVVRRATVAWWRMLFQTAPFTGMRLGEMLGLTWDQVDFKAGTITVVFSSSKSRRSRTYPGGALLAKLAAWRESQGTPAPTDFVFPWTATRRQLYPDWYAIQKLAGIPYERRYTFKDCRSTCATQLIEAGEPTLVVKDWLGHSTVQTTERYYARTEGARREAAARRKVVG